MEIMIKFELGKLVATQGVADLMESTACHILISGYMRRHARGDWGELCEEDKQVNEDGLKNDGRLLSAYSMPGGEKIWIITEADRSITTVLLPSEY